MPIFYFCDACGNPTFENDNGQTPPKGAADMVAICEECAKTHVIRLVDTADLKEKIFRLLDRKYVQRADTRQKSMGLQYMEAETHDLAELIATMVSGVRKG